MTIDFYKLAAQVGQALQKRSLKLVIAESCTGGLASAVVTSIGGSSEWFDRGFVTYSVESKQEVLQVDSELIIQYGVVSEAVARAMAEGALRVSHAEVAIAITGFAGPSGGTMSQPVGTVCFGWARKDHPSKTLTQHFEGDRTSIREQAVQVALSQVLHFMNER